MTVMSSSWKRFWLATVTTLLITQLPSSTGSFGVNYGRIADNLPPASEVISLYKKCGIQYLRLFDPNQEALEALKGSNLQVSLGIQNGDLQSLSSSPEAASQWVSANVAPYKNDVNFQWITIGNEVIPGEQASYVAQAMENIYNAIQSVGLTNTKVTTSISMGGMVNTYPPSNGAFSSDVESVMRDVVNFLIKTGSPLMVNVYPYLPYSSDPQHISFEYASFQATDPVIDGNLKYYSLFDAMVDSVYAALEKIGGANVPIVVSETGWPTKGNEPYTSIGNAQVYNTKLLTHAQSADGTPRRPGKGMDVFIFAMFNEDQKQGTLEQNWGIFNPDMSPVYTLLNC